MNPIVDYFEHTYIRVQRIKNACGNLRFLHNYRSPPYHIHQPFMVLNDIAKTNNMSEVWHNKFQTVVGKHHPSMHAFLEELQKEQAD